MFSPNMRFLFVFALFLSACSVSGELTGEIYVVTNGRDTIKLSGSYIFLVPYNAKTLAKAAEFEKTGNIDILRDKDLASIQTITADADGKFRLTAPRGKYFISAMETRGPIGNQQFFHWFVPVIIPGTVTLNNDNMQDLTP
jgi:hypothetical protein